MVIALLCVIVSVGVIRRLNNTLRVTPIVAQTSQVGRLREAQPLDPLTLALCERVTSTNTHAIGVNELKLLAGLINNPLNCSFVIVAASNALGQCLVIVDLLLFPSLIIRAVVLDVKWL